MTAKQALALPNGTRVFWNRNDLGRGARGQLDNVNRVVAWDDGTTLRYGASRFRWVKRLRPPIATEEKHK
jgi:hypothetical protein